MDIATSGEVHPGSKKLNRILVIVIAGFFLSLFFHYELGAVRNLSYPLGSFLYRPNDQFQDFYALFQKGSDSFSPAPNQRVLHVGWGSVVIMLRSWLLYHLFGQDSETLVRTHYLWYRIPWMISQLSFLVGTFYFVRKVIREVSPSCLWGKVFALTLLSYPVLISLDRSNFENTIFLLLAASLFLYKEGFFVWSALCLGAVISVKPYGIVFLALPLVDRRFKETAIAVGFAALITLGALWVLPGAISENVAALRDSMVAYHKDYVLGNDGLFFGSSLFGLAKVGIYYNHWFLHGADSNEVAHFMHRFTRYYFRFALVCYGLVVLLLAGFRMELWKKAALLVCCMNLLPYVCADYRLMHLFIPLLLFLLEKKSAPGDDLFAALFGLLLVPTAYVHFYFDPVFRVSPFEVSDSVVIHPLLMVALVLAIVFTVLSKPVATDAGPIAVSPEAGTA